MNDRIRTKHVNDQNSDRQYTETTRHIRRFILKKANRVDKKICTVAIY